MGLPVPEYIQLYPTIRCNQRCSFCFNDAGAPSTTSADMPRDKASRLLDVMESHNIRELDIMGGEPFMLSWMPDFIREALGRNCVVNISTNGSLTDRIKKLEGINSNLLTIGISLEGSSQTGHDRLTGSHNFSAAIESLQWLITAGLNPLVKTVVTTDTAGDIQPIIDVVRRHGVRRYFLIHVDHFSHNVSLRGKMIGYQEFLRLTDKAISANLDMEVARVTASCFNGKAAELKIRCTGGTKKIAVMPDGSVFPCNLFQAFPEFRLGNIFSDTVPDIMSHHQLKIFRTRGNNLCPVSDCGHRINCTGGCPAHGYYHSGNPDAPDMRCLTSAHIPCRRTGP